jgi:tRNA A37 threonylcarbamoyladenosine synthetase subunit TsaC/SUA5/YrdC
VSPDGVRLDAGRPAGVAEYWTSEQVDAALETMKRGGLILVKGDIGYGLFGTSRAALEKMYRVKGRPLSNPAIIAGNLDVLDEIAVIARPEIREWIEEMAAWTTLAVVLPARAGSRCLRRMDPWVRQRSVTDGSLAVFLRTGPYLEEVIAKAFAEGWIFAGSSANKSSHGNTFRFGELSPELLQEADLAVNHGLARLVNPGRLATTMVNFTNWTIRRAGVNHEQIASEFEQLKRRLPGGS